MDLTKITPKEMAGFYEKNFTPDIYYQLYTLGDSTEDGYTTNILGMLHRIFTIDITSVESMIDLGCGPTMFPAMSASRSIKRIVCSDFMDKNLQEVRKWLNCDPDAHDWSSYFKQVARLENESDIAKLEKRVRNSITDVVHCDLKLTNPIAPHTDHFDVVYTGFVYDSVCTSLGDFTTMVANTANLLNEGGYFISTGVFNADHYYLGDVMFPAYSFTKEMLDKAMIDVDLEPVLWTTFPKLDKGFPGDFGSLYVVLAKKKKRGDTMK